MESCKAVDFVNVAIRIKPSEKDTAKSVKLIGLDPPVLLVPEKHLSFSFDNVFTEDSTQACVYNETVKPLLNHVISGYDSTIFAYGPTGTGKTYTIGSDPTYCDKDNGLISRTLNELMMLDLNSVEVHVSFIEIYNEKVYDLLNNNKSALQVKGFSICGMTKHRIETLEVAHKLLLEGGKNRHTAETKQNSQSSRSHAIFTIYCKVKHENHETEAKFNLVDLAGSESVKKTGNEGSQFHEGVNINKGLLCVGLVIHALTNNHVYVPYRQSTITTILQDSLNKKNYVTLIACIGTNPDDLTETVQTLEFAQRAKKMRSRPELNSIVSEFSTKTTTSTISSRSTPLKPLNTPNRIKLSNQFRSGLASTVQRRNVRSALSTDVAATPMMNTLSTLHEMPAISPIIRRCIQASENHFLRQLTSLVTAMATPMPQRMPLRISQQSLQREVNNIVRQEMHLDTEMLQSFRDEFGSDGDTGACVPNDNDDCTETDPSSLRYLEGSIRAGSKLPVNAFSNFKRPTAPTNRSKQPARTIFTSTPEKKKYKPSAPTRRSIRLQNLESTRILAGSYISPQKVRRSVRLSRRPVIFTPEITSSKRKRKLPATVRKVASPKRLESHAQKVLGTLNNGSAKELMKLPRIGLKFAMMIVTFRDLKGPFQRIEDVEKMPWGTGQCKRFLTENFLSI